MRRGDSQGVFMAYLNLIRHGQAHCLGARGDHLSPYGQEQSGLLGEYFAAGRVAVDYIASGSRPHQKETAGHFREVYLSRGLPVPEIITLTELDGFNAEHWISLGESLCERDPGCGKILDKWKKLRRENERKAGFLFTSLTMKILQAWLMDQFRADQIEPFSSYREKVRHLIDGLPALHQYANLFLFTSLTPVAILIQHSLGIEEPQGVLKLVRWMYNSSVTTFYRHRSRLELVSVNKVPHLPNPNARTLV